MVLAFRYNLSLKRQFRYLRIQICPTFYCIDLESSFKSLLRPLKIDSLGSFPWVRALFAADVFFCCRFCTDLSFERSASRLCNFALYNVRINQIICGRLSVSHSFITCVRKYVFTSDNTIQILLESSCLQNGIFTVAPWWARLISPLEKACSSSSFSLFTNKSGERVPRPWVSTIESLPKETASCEQCSVLSNDLASFTVKFAAPWSTAIADIWEMPRPPTTSILISSSFHLPV